MNNNNNNLPVPHQNIEDGAAYIPHVQPPNVVAHLDLGNPVAAMMHHGGGAPAAPIHNPLPVDVGVSAHAQDSQVLDYMIIAIVVAILALIVRKMYCSTEV